MAHLQRLNLIEDSGAVENGTTIQTNTTPFMIGYTVLARFYGEDFNGTSKIQTSEDGTTWADAHTVAMNGDDKVVTKELTLKQYVRAVTSAFTAGTVTVELEA